MKPEIMVVGSYAVGLTMKTDRFPTIGETIIGHGFQTMHGGKGSNQAITAACSGAEVYLLACIGDDQYGKDALKLYEHESVNTQYINIHHSLPTGAGFVMVDKHGNNEILLDFGANNALCASDVKNCAHLFNDLDIVIMQMEIPLEPIYETISIRSCSLRNRSRSN